MSNENKEVATWTIDLKKTGTVYKGSAKPKADVTIILSDDTLTELAEGKVSFRFTSSAWRGLINPPEAKWTEGVHDRQTEDEG